MQRKALGRMESPRKPTRDVVTGPLPLPLPSRAADPNPAENRRKRIGAVVKAEREKKRWSQGHLGELAGYNQTAISKIERGDFDVRTETLEAITEALGLPAGYIDRLAIGTYTLGTVEFRAKIAITRAVLDGSLHRIATSGEDVRSVLARYEDAEYASLPIAPRQLQEILTLLADEGIVADGENGGFVLWEEDPRSNNHVLSDFANYIQKLLDFAAMDPPEVFGARCDRADELIKQGLRAATVEEFLASLEAATHCFIGSDIIESQIAYGYHKAIAVYYHLLVARAHPSREVDMHCGLIKIVFDRFRYQISNTCRGCQFGAVWGETGRPREIEEPMPSEFLIITVCNTCKSAR